MKVLKKIILIVAVIAIGILYAYGSWSKPIYDSSIGSSSYIMTEQLEKAMSAEQEFICPNNGLDTIVLKIAMQNSSSIGDYSWKLEDSVTDKIVGQGKIELKNIDKKGITNFKFNKIDNSKDKIYKLTITANNVEKDSIALFMTTKGEYAKALSVNDKSIDQSTIVKMKMTRFNTETFIVFLGLVVYVVLFIRFMYRLFR
ncbi:MAG: hypothetical protein PHX08_00600 [Lachnospiraceae bacterium]|nr:hypothetical protein [Lachnospiraceae bacterium]